MTRAVRFPAPGKLNLFLHVIGRRDDGYHLLETLFTFIDFADILSFTLREDGKILRGNAMEGIAPDEDLCLRAAGLLQRETRCPRGAEIRLEKRLPIGAGLGGGSSDAATTLLALNRLWGLGLARAALQKLAEQLGADVPIFVFGRSAFAGGIGEMLREVVLPPAWYVVLMPPVEVSTREIFASEALTGTTSRVRIAGFSKRFGHNDLEPIVCSHYPVVGEHLRWLRQYGDAAMTGSGACVFARFATRREAVSVMMQRPPGMRGVVARGLNTHPLAEMD
jgi:4-diphosphocytidyl-2-C-methyl-D-erythritol kinase